MCIKPSQTDLLAIALLIYVPAYILIAISFEILMTTWIWILLNQLKGIVVTITDHYSLLVYSKHHLRKCYI